MEFNRSLSARVKRRNAQGFAGIGSYNGVGPKHTYGNYSDVKQNHKGKDYEIAKRRKQSIGCYAMSKKYADNHQKLNISNYPR